MADTPYPLPRELRQTDVLVGSGGATYGPFSFKIFDIEDVSVLLCLISQKSFQPIVVTVEKLSIDALSHFRVTFPMALPITARFVVVGKRLAERSAGVRKGSQISPDALEKEFSKLALTDQELRRDIGRAILVEYGEPGVTMDAGIPDGSVLVRAGDRIAAGPSLSEQQAALAAAIAAGVAAQASASSAATSAGSAAASATEAGMYAQMVGAAVYDFNFDSDPETPGYDWNA